MKELGKTIALAIISELLDPNKATRKYLHIIDPQLTKKQRSKKQQQKPQSIYSWEHCPQGMKDARMLGKAATNDIVESTLGGMTRQLQDYSTIHFSGAAAVNDTCRNNHFDTYHKLD